MNEIERLQDNLLLIRRTVGWTAEEFGDRIGVTRQTINNLEAKRNKLTKTQYIAIRAILDAEMVRSPEDTEMLLPGKYYYTFKLRLANGTVCTTTPMKEFWLIE